MEQFRHMGTGRSVTLQEVATAAGVSSSAASVILNGARSGTRVSDATRQTVLQTATRMGYRPHILAQSLATGRSNRIGVYSGRSRPDSTNLFFAGILTGIFDGAEEFRLDTIVHTSGQTETRLIDLVRGHALDGLVVHAPAGDPILPLLGELLVPAVAIADRTGGFPSVTVDDRAGGGLLAEHLAARGHRHVLVKQAFAPPSSAALRVGALIERCETLGVRVTVSAEGQDGQSGLLPDDLRLLTEGPEGPEGPEGSSGRATAVMAWADHVAQAICTDLESAGLAIPGDVAVVGFDGLSQRYAPRYDISTIRAPWIEVGRQAVRHLNALISGGTVPLITTLPVAFHPGNTT